MSILSKVTSGKQIGAQIHVVMGDNGTGKTTFASEFPKSLFLDLEGGSKHLNVKRLEPKDLPNLGSVREVIKDLLEKETGYETLVIDAAEALERLISLEVCAEGKVDSLEKYEGGYGKGFNRTREIMSDIMVDLQKLRDEKGITSIIIAHTQDKSKTNPATNQTYDRTVMRTNDKMAAVIKDMANNVLFFTYKVFTNEVKGKTQAFGDGQRVMYTSWRPGFDAKNRLELPHELPLSYDAFAEAVGAPPSATLQELLKEIHEMSTNLDEKMRATVLDHVNKHKTDITKLKEIKNRLMKYQTA